MVCSFAFFLKDPAVGFVDTLYSSFCFYLVDLSPEFDYFALSTPFAYAWFLLFYGIQICYYEISLVYFFPAPALVCLLNH